MIPEAAVEAAAKALDDAGYGIRSSDELRLVLDSAAMHTPMVRSGNSDYLPGWDDRKTLAQLWQSHAPLPAEGLSEAVYAALIAVATWGYGQRKDEAL